jgi:dTDP-4-amino-4,6-dideoxygalactose transaminase
MIVPISAKADSAGIESQPDLNAAERVWPQLLRFEDRAEVSNEVWHEANQEKEEAAAIGVGRMSRLTWEILGLLDVEPISARRKTNFSILAEALGAWALLPDTDPTFTPLAYPVVLPEEHRDEVRERLFAERIFPAVHWEWLPSSPEAFPDEHRLSRQILSLPCDHRYEAADMARVAAVFTASANALIQVSAGLRGEGSWLHKGG